MSFLALGFIKLSILFFYRRIFCVSNATVFSWMSIILITLVSVWTVAFYSSHLVVCRGTSNAWSASIAPIIARCVNGWILLYAFAITDFIIDATILVLPLTMVGAQSWLQESVIPLPGETKSDYALRFGLFSYLLVKKPPSVRYSYSVVCRSSRKLSERKWQLMTVI